MDTTMFMEFIMLYKLQ